MVEFLLEYGEFLFIFVGVAYILYLYLGRVTAWLFNRSPPASPAPRKPRQRKAKLPIWYGRHLLVYGSTGKGKSTYAEYALRRIQKSIPEATFVIINPHHRKGQWGLEHCLGAGRNYAEIEAGIGQIVELMDGRYKIYYEDSKADFTDIFVVIDELPAITANTEKGKVSQALKQISSEARKVKIWLIIISQSKLVRQLGFEKASDMLENFIFINVAQPEAKYEIDGDNIVEGFSPVVLDLGHAIWELQAENGT